LFTFRIISPKSTCDDVTSLTKKIEKNNYISILQPFLMKPYALTVIFFCAAIQAFPQSPDAGQQFIREICGTVHVPLPLGQSGQQYPVLFDSIQVVDLRRDTSRIGLIGGGRRSQDEILLSRPVASQVTAFLNAGYSRPQGSHRLLVAVKNLWISKPGSRQGDRPEAVWKVACRFEAYMKTDSGYIPLTYLDTVVRADDHRPEDVAAQHIPQLIAIFMDKVAAHAMADAMAANGVVSYDQIDSFSRTRFRYPMDTAKSLVKGVYVNVREFRNNAPSKTTYEILKDDAGNLTLEIPDEKGQFYYASDVWGFCDGQQAYVMRRGDALPIFSVYHQFYVVGSKNYRDRYFWLPRITPFGDAFAAHAAYSQINFDVIKKLWVFRLDVQSGKVTE
jgi:hypothetical protein